MTRSITNYDRDIGWPGLIAPASYPSIVATHALQANYAYLSRFVPSRNMLIDRIAYYVVTGTGSGASEVDVGIYDQNADQVVAAGATTGKLTANDTVYVVTFYPAPLTAGTIYFAALSSNSTASLMCATWQTGAAVTLFGTAWWLGAGNYMTSSHPLPSVGSLTASAYTPILAVRES